MRKAWGRWGAGLLALGLGLGWVARGDDSARQVPRIPGPSDIISEHFATSAVCADCHSNAPQAKALRDASGRAIAPFDLWQSSMMANAARDPLWRAVVSVEAAATPSRAADIEAKCLGCHSPMAVREAAFQEERPPRLDLVYAPGARGHLARDGVSCTVCHQIQPDGLGTEESFSGHFVIGDQHEIYGPHPDPFTRPMQPATGFRPVQAEHLRSAALCGSCHTLFSEGYHPDGSPTGLQLPEQTPYLEWRNSAFSEDVGSCQRCHVPTRDEDGRRIETAIARMPRGTDFPRVEPRAPYGRHIFVGGNTLIPSILRDHSEELGAQASREAFDETIRQARAQLARAARLWIGEVQRSPGRLSIPVRIDNQTGHKLPTAHPIRRAWVRLVVEDATGTVVFASGDHDAAGRLLARGELLASERAGGPHQPHHRRITSEQAVQLYEAVLSDPEGAPTYLLTRASGFAKDTRILPAGWQDDHPDAPHTVPHGVEGDEDFVPGRDTVHYEVTLGEAPGPYRVRASLLYQTLGARWAAELFQHDTPELRAFRRYYEQADRTPAVIAGSEVTVE